MTTNQTIDGVPRELIERLTERLCKAQMFKESTELRAMLDANPEENGPCPECGGSLCTWGCSCTPRWPMYKKSALLNTPVRDYVLINGMYFSHAEILEWREKACVNMERAAQPQGDTPNDDKSHPRFIAGYTAGLHDHKLGQPQGEPVAKVVLDPRNLATLELLVDFIPVGTYLYEQPAPVAVVPERSPKDYAIEHAEYMAKSADDVLAKFQAYGLALLAVDEGGDDGEGELLENIDSTRRDLQEALVELRGMVYEFRKRAAKS